MRAAHPRSVTSSDYRHASFDVEQSPSDHIYTGQFDGRQDRKSLLALLQLAHRWGVTDVQKRTEALLVNTITPATFLERTYPEQHAHTPCANTSYSPVL